MSLNKDLREKYSSDSQGMGNTIVSAGSVGSLSLKLSEDRWLSDLRIILEGQSSNDTIRFNILDKDFVFKGSLYPSKPHELGIVEDVNITWEQIIPDGVELDRFGDNIPVQTDSQDQGKEGSGYWGKIPMGAYINITYTSTGVIDVKLRCIAYLHKEK